jgi:hypothetical protein
MPVIDRLISEKKQYRFKLVRLEYNSVTLAYGPLTAHSRSEVAEISTQYSPTAQQASVTAMQQAAASLSGTSSFDSVTIEFIGGVSDEMSDHVNDFVLTLFDEPGTDAVVGDLKYSNRVISFRLPEAAKNLDRVIDSGHYPLVLSGIDETQASIGILVFPEPE